VDKRSRRNRLFQYYSRLRIAKLQAEAPAAGQAPCCQLLKHFAPATNLNEDEPDDLPF
jgi:hypothetical protein